MRQCGRTNGLIPCLLCVYSCLTRSVFYSVYRLIDRSVLLPYPICLPLWYAQLNLLHMEEVNCEEMGGNWALRRPKHRPLFTFSPILLFLNLFHSSNPAEPVLRWETCQCCNVIMYASFFLCLDHLKCMYLLLFRENRRECFSLLLTTPYAGLDLPSLKAGKTYSN